MYQLSKFHVLIHANIVSFDNAVKAHKGEDGAVGMVEMALERLSEKNTVQLDEERKAAMVSNLLVVLCGNKDAQPVVNSGSLY